MAESPMSPIDLQRDFRSVHTEWKRSKDHSVKWARGARPSPGVKLNLDGEPVTGSTRQKELCRPIMNHARPQTPGKHENLVKLRATAGMPTGRVRAKIYAQKEIDETTRSLADLAAPLSPIPRRGLSASDNILYSFDRAATPGHPLALDIFVKSTGRDTERLVEKEYEVINAEGDAVTGKKARKVLRNTHTDPGPAEETIVEVDGFELV